MAAHIIPQETLPTLEIPVEVSTSQTRQDLLGRRALAGLLTPSKLGLAMPEHESIYAFAEPDRLQSFLIDVPAFDGPKELDFATDYGIDAELHRPVRVALTAAERKILPLSVRAYGEVARARTLDRQLGFGVADTKARAAGDRATIHTYEGKLSQIETYLGTLGVRSRLLSDFHKASQGRNRGLSRGSEAALRQNFGTYRTLILGDALEAMGHQRQWDKEKKERARSTIEERMIFPREGNQHLDYFQKLTEMLMVHNSAKQAVFRYRRWQLQRGIATRQV